MEIFVIRDEKQYGPYTREQVASYMADGSLSSTDQAWHSGLDTWRRLGELLSPTPLTLPPLPSPTQTSRGEPSAPGRLDIGEALTFPLRDGTAIRRIWWLPLSALIPLFGSILLRGWRLDLVRRVSRNDSPLLPDGRDLGRFLADGVVLVVMTLLYTLPLLVFLAVFGYSGITAALEVLWWAVQTFSEQGAASFWSILADVVLGLLVNSIVPILYSIGVWPLYRMAMVRFALTGSAGTFFQVWRNLRLCLRLMPEIFLAFFVDFLALGFLRWTARALIALGVGVVIAPLATALYFWSTGHLFGQIASKVANLEGQTG